MSERTRSPPDGRARGTDDASTRHDERVRVLQVSDTHLGLGVPMADEQWQAALDHVERTRPDLVVHTGDVTLDGIREHHQLVHARDQLRRLTVPFRVVPGNHDIGDVDDPQRPIDPARVAAFVDAFGPTSWCHDETGWRLVGLDIQALHAGDDELAEWLWPTLATDTPTALFLHRPLRPWGDALDKPERYVYQPWRTRLLDVIAEGNVRLVASGHVHQFLDHEDGGVRHVWGPSSWAVLPDTLQEHVGEKWVGVVEYQFAADGSFDAAFIRPAGMRDVTGGVDFPSPY